jgi:hypothetical protein
MTRRATIRALCLTTALFLAACGSSDANPEATATSPAAETTTAPGTDAPESPSDAGAATPGSAAEPVAEAEAPGAAPAEGEAVAAPSELEQDGTVEIKEYSVAFIGSGSLGKGTLHVDGASHPFRIGGLGIGGIGIASIDARGRVYHLNDLNDFPGMFGKARMGFAIADAGEGRLWLKNTKGVVLELWSEMAGLALTLGADGLVVKWESDYQRGLSDVKEAPKKAWEGTKKGAKSAVDAVKQPFE